MSRLRLSPLCCLLLALAFSVLLTIITLTPPTIPADWARLNPYGMYIPLHIAYHWPSYGLQIALWLGMIAALWWSTPIPSTSFPHAMEKGGVKNASRVYVVFGVIFITLLGFGLRLYSLNSLPLIVDEIGFAAHASDILHGQAVPIFAPGHNANPSTYSWLVAGAMALFGQNTFAIRLIPLVFGTLSIPAAYLLGRAWWSKRIGLLAAAFLATYPAHVFFSRLSLYNIVDPFFAMLALAFLAQGIRALTPSPSSQRDASQWRGEEKNHLSRQYFVLAGIAAGIAQYFYHGSRLLPLLMVVYIVIGYLTQRRKEAKTQSVFSFLVYLRVSVIQLFWVFVPFVLVALPRYAPMLLVKLPITGNMETIRLPADLADNTLRAVLAWVGEPDVSPFWLSDQPLLLLPALLAFLLGLWVCLRRWRDARSIVLLLTLPLTTIFGGAIWTAAPLYVRYITAVPLIALLVAAGMEKIFCNVRLGRGGSQTLPYVGIMLILIIVFQGIYVSLLVHPQQAYAAIVPGHWEEDALAKQAAQLPPDTAAVLLVSPDFGTDAYDGALQMMTIAHYVAAYGERRAIIVNAHDPVRLQKQLGRLDSRPYMTIEMVPPQ